MTQAQAPQLPAKFEAPIGLKGVIPQNIQELFQLADMAVQSGLAPRGVNKVQAAGIMAFGMELGMTPLQSLGCISFINGKAAVYGDGITGLIHQSGHLERMEETIAGEGDARTATCRMWRRGNVEPFVGRFSVGNAKQAGLWGKNTWAQYPDRMLTHRARGWAARDGFSDCLKGLWTREEAEDMGHSNGRPLVSQSRSLEPKTFPEKAGNYQGKAQEGPPQAQDSKILDQVDREAQEDLDQAEADPPSTEEPEAPRDLREESYAMATDLGKGNDDAIAGIFIAESWFKGTDGKDWSFSDPFRKRKDGSYVTSDRWIQSTYGKIKARWEASRKPAMAREPGEEG